MHVSTGRPRHSGRPRQWFRLRRSSFASDAVRYRPAGSTHALPHDHIEFDKAYGYTNFSSPDELVSILTGPLPPFPSPAPPADKDPSLFVLLPPPNPTAPQHNADLHELVARTGFDIRQFQVGEVGKLHFDKAREAVARSVGVVIPLLSDTTENRKYNHQAVAVAAFARGMAKPHCVFQQQTAIDPPFDLRYQVENYDPGDTGSLVHRLNRLRGVSKTKDH